MSDYEEPRYYKSSKDWWRYDPKHSVVGDVPIGSRVLDVGCAYGDLGAALKTRDCIVEGVENYPLAVAEASERLDTLYVVDLNDVRQLDAVPAGFDVITAMDVLEHTTDPWAVLAVLRGKLKIGGTCYVSVPNVANIKTRLGLMCGQFDYTDYGVLDRTHLRFFTRSTATSLMHGVFGNVEMLAVTPAAEKLAGLERVWPSMFALQFVMKSRNG